MDPRVMKLKKTVGDTATAKALVDAGITLPRQVKQATEKILEAIVGKSKAKELKRL